MLTFPSSKLVYDQLYWVYAFCTTGDLGDGQLIGVLTDSLCSSGSIASIAFVVTFCWGVLLLEPPDLGGDLGSGQLRAGVTGLEPKGVGTLDPTFGVPCLDPATLGLVDKGSGFLAPDLANDPSAPATIVSNGASKLSIPLSALTSSFTGRGSGTCKKKEIYTIGLT